MLVFALPIAARFMHLPAGVAGAWIGTSEFADAAGLAAAQSYGGLVGEQTGISGTPDQAIQAYTLIKVVGRDAWIGIWAFVLSIVSITVWERSESTRSAQAAQIWWRFPKFIVGFLFASLLITYAARGVPLAEYTKTLKPTLVTPLIALRTWCFTFCFLSIGFSTRLREFAPAGGRTAIAFSVGVLVNLILGYFLSVHIFGENVLFKGLSSMGSGR